MTPESNRPYRACVIVASTRAATGVYPDRSGPILVAGLQELGFLVDPPVVVVDGEPVGEALRSAVAAGVDVVVTSGGTGCSPHDHTPEQTRALIDREVPGIAEAIRAEGRAQGVATADLSRGIAGLVGSVLVVNVAGSPGAARDALVVLKRLLIHVLEQINGRDHGGP
jgi:molybdenum cofactor synthesis domain-containing protein